MNLSHLHFGRRNIRFACLSSFSSASLRGGITIFAGGMPRSTYGDRSTVSLLRGSNLDQAAAANLAAAVRLAHADGDLEDEDEEEEEADFEDEDQQNLLAGGLVPGAPVHVFDADAPEHVCLDLPSPLVDVCPLGPAGGPATGVLILCEEELVAVDLLTPGWPLLTLPYLSCLHTSAISAYNLFTHDARRNGDDENDPWPPFRRAGLFDPFMDDPRAAVKCIQLVENTLVVGGAAGQVGAIFLPSPRLHNLLFSFASSILCNVKEHLASVVDRQAGRHANLMVIHSTYAYLGRLHRLIYKPSSQQQMRSENDGDCVAVRRRKARVANGGRAYSPGDTWLSMEGSRSPQGDSKQRTDKLASQPPSRRRGRWCQLRDTVQSTALDVLGRARSQHQDWFDDNDEAINALLAENRLKKKTYDAWMARKAEEIQGYADRDEWKNFLAAMKTVYGRPVKGAALLLSSDRTNQITAKKQILKRWAGHLQSVRTQPSAISNDTIDRLSDVETNADLNLLPSVRETIRTSFSHSVLHILRLFLLTLSTQLRALGPSRSPGMSLYPVGIALTQPPAQITSLAVCELPATTAATPVAASPEPAKPGVVLVGFGTPHGFGLVHWAPRSSDGGADSPPTLILAQSTIPLNSEALEEAAVGEGWARRRTRELKNSLRDSFRRLKRMRSTSSSIRRAPSNVSTPPSTTAPASTVARPAASHMSARVGLRRSVTQGRPATMQVSGDPLQEAIQRSQLQSDAAAADLPMPSGGEREICDRPAETASTAVVRCVAFGPALHRIRAPAGTAVLVGSFFASTTGGATNVYALFADRANQPSQLAVRHASELVLHHRAPVIALRLIDTKTHIPFSPNSKLWLSSATLPLTLFAQVLVGRIPKLSCGLTAWTPVISHRGIGSSSLVSSNSPPPHLVVVSEEQVRLFSLPSLHLRQKVRITAKDGFRIKAASIVTFQQTAQFDGCFDKMAGSLGDGSTSHHQPSPPIGLVRGSLGPEFGLVFTNNGGQAVVLSIPYLRRKDTIALLGPLDLLAVNSVAFAANATSACTALAPSLGVYQLAHGQVSQSHALLLWFRYAVCLSVPITAYIG
ncbi:unnamed protein product [Schistocephalus solidus]|uniref:Reverse transcriptase domain-containing protein n=1 Tax=Schistocephalus solidus TaxID=70667 RepID=A0A183SFF6_SCHSO|nr:unnamed protein product [Schistocephalus solidus]